MKVENRCLLLTLTRFHEDLLQVVFKLIKIVYMCDVVRVSRSDHKQFIVTDAVPNSHSNCADSLVLKQKKKMEQVQPLFSTEHFHLQAIGLNAPSDPKATAKTAEYQVIFDNRSFPVFKLGRIVLKGLKRRVCLTVKSSLVVGQFPYSRDLNV